MTSTRRDIDIGEVIRDAHWFDFRRLQEAELDPDRLPAAVSRLFEILAERNVAYVVVGGIAMLQYVEGRNTKDIDLIVDAASLESLPELRVTGRGDGFVRATFDALQLDFRLTENRLFDRVRRDFVTERKFGARTVAVASVEGLILLKLYALPSVYRQGSLTRVGLYESDVFTLIGEYRPKVEPLFAILSEHLSATDLTEVRRVVGEIEQKIQRVERRRT